MRKSKKVFILFVTAFILLLGYASYDISTRTTFPGSKPQLKQRIEKEYLPEKVGESKKDSILTDSTGIKKK